MEREDIDPWYRQFWPWFLITLPAIAVVAGLYTLWLAMQSQDSLVVRSDDGMNVATERNLAAEAEAVRLGLVADVDIILETGAVVVTLSSLPGVDSAASLQLQMRHPTMAPRDAVIDVVSAMPNADGRPAWAGHFVKPLSGRYYVILSSGDDWRLSGEWSGQSHFTLGTADQPGNGQH